MGFIDGLFNAVKSKYGYSSGSSKYSSMSDSELMRKARNKDFSGNSSKQIGQAKAMGDELKRRGLR